MTVCAALPEAGALLEEAERLTQLDDWGGAALFEPSFRVLFTALRDSVLADAQLSPKGLAGAALRLRAMAEMRLRLIEDRKRFPGIASETITAPIFILGLPRAGSSFLHSLLARDPDNRAPEAWEMLLPSPPPQPDSYAADPRISRAQNLLDALGLTSEALLAFHPSGARQPEECHMLMEHMALGDILSGLWKVSGFNRVRGRIDPREAYETHRMVLQALQHRMGPRRWVLKNPGHIFQLPALLSVYPDAHLIQTHRDPARVIPSLTATVAAMRKANSDAPVHEARIALANVQAYAAGLETVSAMRAERPALERRFHDVHFHQLIADPLTTVRRCYTEFGLTLSDGAAEEMARWARQSAEHVAKRKFTLAEFGLDEAAIEAHFGAYIERYRVKRERPA